MFKGFFNNSLFLFIFLLTVVIQVVLTEYGSIPVRCVSLLPEQHGVCIAIGSLSLIVGVLAKFLPSRWFKFMKLYTGDEEESIKSGPVNALRKSLTLSMRKKLENQSSLVGK